MEHIARLDGGGGTSKRLAIDIELIKESLADGTVDALCHVPHPLNYSDGLTKYDPVAIEHLEDAISTGELEVPVYSDSPLDDEHLCEDDE